MREVKFQLPLDVELCEDPDMICRHEAGEFPLPTNARPSPPSSRDANNVLTFGDNFMHRVWLTHY